MKGVAVLVLVLIAAAAVADARAINPFLDSIGKRAVNPFLDSIGKRSADAPNPWDLYNMKEKRYFDSLAGQSLGKRSVPLEADYLY